jgi:hydrophobe/amphiphile efflux-3 (HAE3) family protein
LEEHARAVALAAVVITVVTAIGATMLGFGTGQDSYLNKDDQLAKDNKAYQDAFGGQAMLMVLTADEGRDVSDLFTASNRDKLQELNEKLNANGDQVQSVVGPLEALTYTNTLTTRTADNEPSVLENFASTVLDRAIEEDTDPASKESREADKAVTLARGVAALSGGQTLENPAWVQVLLYDNTGYEIGADGAVEEPPLAERHVRRSLQPFIVDATHAQVVVRLQGNRSIEDEGAAASFVRDVEQGYRFDGFSQLVTGAPELLSEINDYLQGGFLTLGGIAVLVMAAILVLLFSVRWRLLPLAVVLVGVLWAFGITGYLGITLTLVTIAGLPILIGVGIDFSIQVHSRIEEEAKRGRSHRPIGEAIGHLGPATLIATVAAAVSFTALQWSEVPMNRQFGILLTIGVAAAWLVAITLPALVIGRRDRSTDRRATNQQAGTYDPGALGRLGAKVGSIPQAFAIPLALLSVVVLVAGLAVENKLDIETDPEKWVNPDSKVLDDLAQMRDETHVSSEIGLFVQPGNGSDVYQDSIIEWIDETTRNYVDQKYPGDLLYPSSLVNVVGFLLDVPDAVPGGVKPTAEEVRQAYALAPPDIQRSVVTADGTAMNVIMATVPSSLDARSVFVNDLRAEPHPADFRVSPGGLAVVGVGLVENLEANRSLLVYLPLAMVFVFLLLALRSPVRAFLVLLPVAIAVGAANLVALAIGINLSPMTAAAAPLIVALCTEFTVLILLRYLEERERGEDPAGAVHVTGSSTGRAFACSALTAIAGVAVLGGSSMPLLRDFGIVTGINITLALLAALVVLPPLIVFADRHGWLKTAQPAGGGHEAIRSDRERTGVR